MDDRQTTRQDLEGLYSLFCEVCAERGALWIQASSSVVEEIIFRYQAEIVGRHTTALVEKPLCTPLLFKAGNSLKKAALTQVYLPPLTVML